ncbi:M16 family metallopeptidase [Parvicella tangerina]|uniref:Zinc protease n=1 Tax=Parvicella tangerina TaxID=2829795 RepID=A0A916JQD6_9FLAO|nr:pitrilysin family protein [Parvicella tangerina]CAG5084536.1 putative zinc protease [Parvicella tangerina]
MIEFNKFKLTNGLTVIHHNDESTPLVAFNILYDVGARDEDENRTGFAHLFEHLMFGGSKHVPNFDEPLQKAGGQNNAFTSNDLTNYYCSLPKDNLETAFWLESDRMLELAFTPKSLEVQRNVVIEEFKQRYLNQPYGDVWLLLRPLAYKNHPYKWATIGKAIEHIADASMDEVKAFFYKHYTPQNAILCVAGDISLQTVEQLSNKYFGEIPSREKFNRNIPQEPQQQEYRELTVERDVPADAIYMAFHMCSRTDPNYHATDLISDILSRGRSSRLFKGLVLENPKFNEISAYVSGSIDNGLFMVTGKPAEGVSLKEAQELIWEYLEDLKSTLVTERELEKVKNKVESSNVFGEMTVLNKAMSLCFYELIADADAINHEVEKYKKVKLEDIKQIAGEIFRKENCSVLNYKAKKS